MWVDLRGVSQILLSTGATLGSSTVLVYGISMQAYKLLVGVVGEYCVAALDLCLLFHLEGMMIADVGTQCWNRKTWKNTRIRVLE